MGTRNFFFVPRSWQDEKKVNFKIVNWAIRQNKDVKGISIENEETKLLQYADDTTAVLSDMDSAKTLFELLDVFKDVSGLKINCTKTEGMWIGASKENKTKPFGIKRVSL